MDNSIIQQKKCGRCKQIRAVSDFYVSRTKSDGLQPICKSCNNTVCKEWRQRNPNYLKSQKIRAWRKAYRKSGKQKESIRRLTLRKFGVNDGHIWYEQKLNEQGSCCAICQDPADKNVASRSLHIDHNHTTMKLRGLLCSHCNFALGLLREDTVIIRRVLEYLAFYCS